MKEDEVRTVSERPRRKPIILIGAPSGAGKTVLSRQIVAGALPIFTRLCGSLSEESAVRHDLKILPRDLPSDRIVIVECATHKFTDVTHTDQWRRLLHAVHESEKIIVVNLDVPRRTVVGQYFRRIFKSPKERHVIWRALHLSKYRNALIYALTRQIARSKIAWEEFGTQLAAEMAPRVHIIRARRCGSDYRLEAVST